MKNTLGKYDLTSQWLEQLTMLATAGAKVSPRGQSTLEIPNFTLRANMQLPVVMQPERRLSYRFMAAEAYWILSGDDRVETIAPYNKNISKYSDDGVTFYGAYGPRIADQFDYVVDTLVRDKFSRQAGLTTWHKKPPETKDVPCTIAIFFNIRPSYITYAEYDDTSKLHLHCSVFMRSSDAWLGIPYDAFTFSMLTAKLCAVLNMSTDYDLAPGVLSLSAASSHIYTRDMAKIEECLHQGMNMDYTQGRVPPELYNSKSSDSTDELLNRLKELRTSKPGDSIRWWEPR